MNLRKGLFGIPVAEPCEWGTYEGYTFGEKWNGFEMPLFDRATAIKILEDSGNEFVIEGSNIVLVWDSAEREIISIVTTEFNGEPIELFDMSLGWVWEAEEITFKEGDKVKFYPEYADGDNGIFVCVEDSDGDRVKVIFPNSTLNFWKTEIVKTEMIYKV